MSVESNITAEDNWFRAENKILEFTVKKADGVTGEDITGWSLRYELCTETEVEVFFKDNSSGGGITITDAPNGVLQVDVDAGDTSAESPGKFKHELRRTDVGDEAQLVHGTVLLQQGCT